VEIFENFPIILNIGSRLGNSMDLSRASVSGRMDVYYAQKIAKYVQNPEVDV